MKFLRLIKGYRTLIVAGLIQIFGVLQASDFSPFDLNKKTMGLITIGIGIAMSLLRFSTTAPVGEK